MRKEDGNGDDDDHGDMMMRISLPHLIHTHSQSAQDNRHYLSQFQFHPLLWYTLILSICAGLKCHVECRALASSSISLS